jgi:hypothetical protein
VSAATAGLRLLLSLPVGYRSVPVKLNRLLLGVRGVTTVTVGRMRTAAAREGLRGFAASLPSARGPGRPACRATVACWLSSAGKRRWAADLWWLGGDTYGWDVGGC